MPATLVRLKTVCGTVTKLTVRRHGHCSRKQNVIGSVWFRNCARSKLKKCAWCRSAHSPKLWTRRAQATVTSCLVAQQCCRELGLKRSGVQVNNVHGAELGVARSGCDRAACKQPKRLDKPARSLSTPVHARGRA